MRGSRRNTPLVELSVTKGTIPAQSVLPVFVTFSPLQRRYHSFRVLCHMQVNGVTFGEAGREQGLSDGLLPTPQYPGGLSPGSSTVAASSLVPTAGRTKEELMAAMPVPMLEVVGLGTQSCFISAVMFYFRCHVLFHLAQPSD
jgi:hypothetical protein